MNQLSVLEMGLYGYEVEGGVKADLVSLNKSKEEARSEGVGAWS